MIMIMIMIMMIMMMIIMIICFCGMVDQRKMFSLISRREHRQRFLPRRISNTSRAGFESAQDLRSGSVECSSDNHYNTAPQERNKVVTCNNKHPPWFNKK